MKLKLILAHIVSLPLYWISLLIPRRPDIWVFGAWFGTRYADNPRYLFEFVQKDKNMKAVWIAKRRDVVSRIRAEGKIAFLRYSPQGIYYMLRAAVAVVGSGLADLNRALVYGAFKINLWHGAPMKKIPTNYGGEKPGGFAVSFFRRLIAKVMPYAGESGIYQSVLATSDYFKPILASAFAVPPDNVQVLGYPRNDVLFDAGHRSGYVDNLKAKLNGGKILAYLPTYRNTFNGTEDCVLFSKYGFDDRAMESFLNETGSILLIKLHYADQEKMKRKRLDFGSRILYVDENQVSDINDVLGGIDVLITDYSGVYFDYLLLNRPVIFAAFDLEEYARETGLYDDYRFYVSGPIAKNWTEVIEYAREAVKNPRKDENMRAEKRNIFNSYSDSKNSQRIFEYLRSQAGFPG